MRRGILGMALLCVVSCSRDFAMPGETDGVSVFDLVITPNPAPLGLVTVEFSTAGSFEGEPEVAILGTALVKAGEASGPPWRFEYQARGSEPQETELLVEVRAGSARASQTLRFDFRMPALVSADPEAALVAPGQSLGVQLVASEVLSAAPTLVLAGVAAECGALPDAARYRCTWNAPGQAPPGWLEGTLVLQDLAGNRTPELPLSLDAAVATPGPANLALLVEPGRATTGGRVILEARADQPLTSAPAVTVAGRDAALESSPGRGVWTYGYEVSGLEDRTLGQVLAVATGRTLAGGEVAAQAPLDIDLEPPTIEAASANVPALKAGETVILSLEAGEPLTGLRASVQGLPFDCASADALTWSCTYVAAGVEAEGPQLVVLDLVDWVGLTARQRVGPLFEFDFGCKVVMSGARLMRRYDQPPAFAAGPGTFEAGATLELRAWSGGEALLPALRAEADGSVPSTDLGQDPGALWVQAEDLLGQSCPGFKAGESFVVDFDTKALPGSANPSHAAAAVVGTPRPDTHLFASPLALGEQEKLAEGDGRSTRVDAGPVPGPAWREHTAGAVGSAEWYPAAIWDARRRAVMIARTVEARGPAWWQGSGWVLDGDLARLPSTFFGAAYDRARDRPVVFGGLHSQATDETWEWTGSFWTQVFGGTLIPSGADPRMLHAMSYDPIRRQSLIFGGVAGVLTKSDLWGFDGAVWERLPSSPDGPEDRSASSMTWFGTAGVSLLFGGRSDETRFGDTWAFDGTAWRQYQPAHSPSPRANHAMAWDEAFGRVLLFGGEGSDGQPLGDLWAWDGQDWTELGVTGGPPPRSRHGLVYDPLRGVLVVVGGRNAVGVRTDELWELDLGRRWPALHARLVPARTELLAPLAASLVVEAHAEWGEAGTGPPQGWALHLWDPQYKEWLLMRRVAPGESSRIELDLSSAALDRFLGERSLEVLIVPLEPNGPGATSSLLVEQLALRLDY